MNRSNVMLTRCKAGMIIVSNQGFLMFGGAQHTLLGHLSQHWLGAGRSWIDWREVAEGKATMPGVPVHACKPQVIPTQTELQTSPSLRSSSQDWIQREMVEGKVTVPGVTAPAHKPQTISTGTKPQTSPSRVARPGYIKEQPITIRGGPAPRDVSGSAVALGVWGNSSGVKAVKQIASTARGYDEIPARPPVSEHRQSLKAGAPEMKEQFPALSIRQVEKPVRGKWKKGSAPAARFSRFK